MISLSRAMMTLASHCLGEARRDWALAMEAEFEAAMEGGKPGAFAAGCLIAAWRQMPTHEEGRLALTNYALVLGLLVPAAAIQMVCTFDLAGLAPDLDPHHAVLAGGWTANPLLAGVQAAAGLPLMVLWLSLCVTHLLLAWALLDRDWPRLLSLGALAAAVAMSLVAFSALLLLDVTRASLQIAWLGIELTAIFASAQWHSRHGVTLEPETI